MFTPSSTRSTGGLTPAMASIVGNTSLPMTGTSLVVPGLRWPGQRARPGTRMPPSCMERLRSRKPPLEPRPGVVMPSPSGPLSEVKKTNVLSVSFCSSSDFMSIPKA